MNLYKIVNTKEYWVWGTKEELDSGKLFDDLALNGANYSRVLTDSEYEDVDLSFEGTTYIHTLPLAVGKAITYEVETRLNRLGFRGDCLERLVDEALNSRLCDIEEVIK